jgi:predicted  nucleic acid-binding Zn-ribbon protein
MSQLLTKLTEFESQIDGELKQIDKKMKELKQQRRKLTGLQKALNPKVNKPKRIVKEVGSNTHNSKDNS